jgi:putative ABC transport system permease protein
VTVKVSGIFAAEEATEEELILVHLEFLQRAEGIKQLGTVTQFEVRIDDPSRAREIASAIDARFAELEEPTFTRTRSAFLARATRELREILRFGRLFGLACVLVVVVLVGNTIAMSVHERRRELGVLRAIGFRAEHLLGAVLLEAGALALVGGSLGAVALVAVLSRTGVAIGVEGVQIAFSTAPAVLLRSFALAFTAALAAGAVPAVLAARREVVRTLRSGG